MILKISLSLLLFSLSACAHEYDFVNTLEKDQKEIVIKVAKSYTPTYGEGKNLYTLASDSVSKSDVTYRLYNYLCWTVMKGADSAKAAMSLAKRDTLFFTPPISKQTITLPTTSLAGDPDSPILATFYMTSSCPSCKKSGIPLYELAQGPLYGKFSMALKPIHNKDADIALLASDKQGKMWELFTSYGEVSERIDKLKVFELAENIGIDVAKLSSEMLENEPLYVEILAQNRQEGHEHGLKYTPTLFFNGVRYASNRHPIWIVDYIEWIVQSK